MSAKTYLKIEDIFFICLCKISFASKKKWKYFIFIWFTIFLWKKEEKSIFFSKSNFCLQYLLLAIKFLGKHVNLLFYKTNIFYQEYIFFGMTRMWLRLLKMSRPMKIHGNLFLPKFYDIIGIFPLQSIFKKSIPTGWSQSFSINPVFFFFLYRCGIAAPIRGNFELLTNKCEIFPYECIVKD